MAYSKQQLIEFLKQPEFMALLDTIGYAEGADYNDVFGYKFKITNFSDHPRVINRTKGYSSDVSGRYQFLAKTWDGRRKALSLDDFSPRNQDIAGLSLVIDVRGVNPNLISNPSESNFLSIMNRLTCEWCSLPGTNRCDCNGQPQKTFKDVYSKYREFLELRQSGKVPPSFTGNAVATSNGSLGNTPNSFDLTSLLSGGLLNDSSDYCAGIKPLTFVEAKTYRGCEKRININPAGLLGIGAAAGGITNLSKGSPFPSIVDNIPTFVDFQPGVFIDPMTGQNYKITSERGMRWGRMHQGIDLAAPTGTPINAIADGTVTYASYQGGVDANGKEYGYGNVIILKHANGFGSLYAHASKLLVKKNHTVRQGQVIMLCGTSGGSTGPHLHFEIAPKYSGSGFLNGLQVNPRNYVKFK